VSGDQPGAPNQRSFSLNSKEAFEALCPWTERPFMPRGTTSADPRWLRESDGAWVSAEDEESAGTAFAEWLWHVEAGRIGG